MTLTHGQLNDPLCQPGPNQFGLLRDTFTLAQKNSTTVSERDEQLLWSTVPGSRMLNLHYRTKGQRLCCLFGPVDGDGFINLIDGCSGG